MLIFFMLGLVYYLGGCHDTLRSSCSKFKTEAFVIDHYTTVDQCSYCRSYRKKSSGTRYCYDRIYYDCYDSYAKFEFVHENTKRTCRIKAESDESSMSEALYDAQKEYELNKKYIMYVDEDYDCHDSGEIESDAVTGFVFLIITGVMLVVLLFFVVGYHFKFI